MNPLSAQFTKLGNRFRAGVVIVTVLGSIFLTGIAPSSAFALAGCRSDPVIVLSNLRTLDVSATIYDSTSDLRSVTYTVHGPSGTSVVLALSTDGLVGQVEHFKYVADQLPNHYSVTAYVSTGTTSRVTVSGITLAGRSESLSGYSNQPITFNF